MSEEYGVPIDWENPFDEIRSSEVDDITLEFLDNGVKVSKMDDKGNSYTQFKWSCMRMDISNPSEVLYLTSSKKLIAELRTEAPLVGRTFQILRSGTGFQTKYNVKTV
ncbi:MAG: hypothetical protein GY853_00680 [PVC group bacterium]|nr:hypothetical protein [PVC group bacterium]